MTTLSELSDLDLLDTMEDLLEKRMIAAYATNTTLVALLRELQPFTWTQGEPPKGKLLDTPGGYVWIIRERPYFNANGSVMFQDFEVGVRIALNNKVSYKPLPMNSDGTFKDFVDEEHTPLREIHAVKKGLRLVIETEAYDNDWYYDFVQNGILGEVNRISINYDRFGGAETSSNLFVQYFTMTYTVRCWSESSVQISKGTLAISLTSDDGDTTGVEVKVTDHYGNTIWDNSGNSIWIDSGGSGSVTVTNAVAQKDVTVTATKSSFSGNATGVNIANGTSTAVAVNLSVI